MKKIITVPLLISLLVLPAIVAAQPPPAAAITPETLPQKTVYEVTTSIMKWMYTILLIVAAICIIIAAFMFVTAGGNPESVKTARNFVLYAVIGIVVAGLAWGIVALMRAIVGP